MRVSGRDARAPKTIDSTRPDKFQLRFGNGRSLVPAEQFGPTAFGADVGAGRIDPTARIQIAEAVDRLVVGVLRVSAMQPRSRAYGMPP